MTMDRSRIHLPKDWLRGETFKIAEVARVFRVDPLTVARWAKAGKIGYFRTPGGNRVIPEAEVERLLKGEPAPDFVLRNAEIDGADAREKWEEGFRRSGKSTPFGGNPDAPDKPFYTPGVDEDPDAEQ